MAAEQNEDGGQFGVGYAYANGLGVEKDENEAAKWYRKAADQGHTAAQNNLGVLYLNGKGGLPKDEAEAARWYRKAADQGLSTAQNNLGTLSEQGRGVPQNFVEAYMWFSLAAASGHTEAPANRDRVEKKMTTDQIAEAQRRAAEITARQRN